MISIVIRNKNEAKNLENVLHILKTLYDNEYSEIILVDNYSTDNSIEIAKKYNCNIITITDFTYGKAINLGIEKAKNDCVLLLSSHAIPVGKYFFKSLYETFQSNSKIAGIRFINSYTNYKRAIANDFIIQDGITYGLMAACAVVNKNVWNKIKFDETLVFSEDKDWSQKVIDSGYLIFDCNETFYYFSKITNRQALKRYENEMLAEYQVSNKKFPHTFKIIGSLCYKIAIKNNLDYFKILKKDFNLFFIKLRIKNKLKK